jgi:hypothetical protein
LLKLKRQFSPALKELHVQLVKSSMSKPVLNIDYYKVSLSNVQSSFPSGNEGAFTRIPPELVFKILCLLDCGTLIKSCRGVCKRWENVVKLIPAKIHIPKGYWRPGDLFTEQERWTEKALFFAAERLAWGNCRRYKKALSQEPVQREFFVSERESFLQTDPALQEYLFDSGRGEASDRYFHIINGLVIRTEANFPKVPAASQCFYIEIWKEKEPITRMKFQTPEGFALQEVQYLLCDDLLIARILWNQNHQETVQMILCQYTTSTCFFNSREYKRDNPDFPPALLKICSEFGTLLSLKIQLISDRGKVHKFLCWGLGDKASQRGMVLQYNLDVSPGN